MYDPAVWTSISRRYRTVARLPEGEDAETALRRAYLRRWGRLPAPVFREALALDNYLRNFAPPEDTRELTPAEWAAFLRAGGGSAGTDHGAMRRHRANPAWQVPA